MNLDTQQNCNYFDNLADYFVTMNHDDNYFDE